MVVNARYATNDESITIIYESVFGNEDADLVVSALKDFASECSITFETRAKVCDLVKLIEKAKEEAPEIRIKDIPKYIEHKIFENETSIEADKAYAKLEDSDEFK